MKRALVTGGAGFIGSHLARALVSDGWDVHAIDDFHTGKIENVRGFTCDRMDVRALTPLTVLGKFDVVFHLAAQSSYRFAITQPRYDLSVNTAGTLEVCEYCRATGARLVFASSAGGVYGDTSAISSGSATEHTLPYPTSPYGVSKLAAEEYIKLFARQYGVKAVILRLANVYGVGQDVNGEAGVIARFAGQAARGEALTVRGNGSQTRDFVHVDDVVRAFVLAAGYGFKRTVTCPIAGDLETLHTIELEEPYQVFNISRKTPICISFVAEVFGKYGDVGIAYLPSIAEEPQNMCFSNDHAREVLNWKPERWFWDSAYEVLDWARAEHAKERDPRTGEQISAAQVINQQ